MSASQGPESAGEKPGARMRRADRKRQLLSHAKQLFVTLGYQNTTTEKIARAAGVSEPMLYRHFESKKALFLEVLKEIREATLTRWQSVFTGISDPLAKIHAVADSYLGSTREHALEYRIMHRSLVETEDEEIRAMLRAFYLDSEAVLAQIIGEGQQAGVFRPSLDPRIAAWELIRTALGYTLTLPLRPPIYEEPDYLPRAIEFLLQSLLKNQSVNAPVRD
jgi:AcrR family transcriptional regulator